MRVEPDGPVPCDLAIFGEAPGFEEQQIGRGFVGKSGQQLWSDMGRFTGLTRKQFYVSNVVKEGLPKNRDPKPDEVAAALPEFMDELERVRPKVVVTAGAFATRAVLGNVLMGDVHGIPHHAEIAGREFVCMPVYHPAAGLHNKAFLAAFAYDLGRFSAFLKGDLQPWAPTSRPAVTQWLRTRASDVPGYLAKGLLVGLDTEGWPEKPWGLSFSPDGQHGYVIPWGAPVMDWFRRWIRDQVVVMHNGLHDLAVLRAMGVEIERFHDTQVLGFHDILRTGSGILEAESQNLSTLAYREVGMRSWGELRDFPGVDFDAQMIPYSDEIMHYAGMDPIAAWRLFKVYDSRGLTEYDPYVIDMGQVGLVRRMIDAGIPFELTDALDYYTDVIDKLDTCTIELKAKAARLGVRDFNPGSHPQVRDLLTRKIGLRIRKRTKGGLASTNEKALADHKQEPFVQHLQTHRELSKLKGTYLGPLLEELNA
jgi:uracil-DNA glycosylase family 4